MLTSSEIDKLISESLDSLNIPGEPSELYNPIKYIISIGGKRIRPKLSLIAYNIFSDKIDQSIISPSLALEVFHAFTLVHDDIMDKSDLRRGKQTIHKKWSDNIAILSGDVMSILSYKLLAYAPNEHLQKSLEIFSTMGIEVCEGQQFDMNFENKDYIVMDDYIKMIGLKTAALIASAAKLGATIAGADDKTTQAIYDSTYQVGIAFQIADDYLDVYSNSETLGKKIGEDIVSNKKTWLLIKAQELAKGEQVERLQSIMTLPEDRAEEKIKLMTELYSELDIPRLAEEEVIKYHNHALEIISQTDIPSERLGTFNEFARSLTHRKY